MTCELTDPVDLGPIPHGTPALWLEMCVKYDVPEFGAKPLPLPTFDSVPATHPAARPPEVHEPGCTGRHMYDGTNDCIRETDGVHL